MDLNYWQGYLATYHFLDAIMDENIIDDLVLAVGSMDPYIWKSGLPMDKEFVVLWINVFKKEDVLKEEANEDECFRFMIDYLEQLERYFTLDLKIIINRLKETINDKQENKELWTKWIDTVMYVLSNPERD